MTPDAKPESSDKPAAGQAAVVSVQLVVEARTAMRIHRVTVVVVLVALAIQGGLNCWPGNMESESALDPPNELPPILQLLFFRGWPLSPAMLCLFHGGRWHPEEGFIWSAFLLDAISIAFLTLSIGAFVEWCVRKRNRPFVPL